MRILKWSLALLVMSLAAGAWWAYQSRDDLLARAIRRYGPEIVGAQVELGDVQLSPLDGMATLQHLQIGNPKGFKSPHALVVEQFRVRLDAASLTQPVVHILEVTVQQPEVGYEHASSGSNLDAIQRHVEAYVAAHRGATTAQDANSSDSTRVIIDHFHLTGARAQVRAELLQDKVVTLVLPDIHLRDIGRAAGGVTPAAATAQIVAALRHETAQAVMPLHLDGVVGSIQSGAAALAGKVKGFFK